VACHRAKLNARLSANHKLRHFTAEWWILQIRSLRSVLETCKAVYLRVLKRESNVPPIKTVKNRMKSGIDLNVNVINSLASRLPSGHLACYVASDWPAESALK
jgi:hypothetical protein